MEAEEFSPDHTDDGNDELDQSVSNSQEAKPDVNETDPASFVKQKADEKKGHKSKKAKEKPRSKKAAVKSEEQIVTTGNINDPQEEEKIREQRIRIQQEKLAKLAQLAKKETCPVMEARQEAMVREEEVAMLNFSIYFYNNILPSTAQVLVEFEAEFKVAVNGFVKCRLTIDWSRHSCPI